MAFDAFLDVIFRKNENQLKDKNFKKHLLFEAEQKYIKKWKWHFNSESWVYDNNRELREIYFSWMMVIGHFKELFKKEVDLMLESLCLVTELLIISDYNSLSDLYYC